MAWKTEFTEFADNDFSKLDGSLQRLVDKQLDKLEQNPEAGKTLGNKMNLDLTGYRALYFLKKGYRLVYKLIPDRQIIEIWGIGRRDKEDIYHMLAERVF